MTADPSAKPSQPAPVAALDCGTNSTRLLVVDGGGVSVERQMRITRLGQGVDATGLLSPDAIERTVAVLADYRRTMDALGVARARLVATSAVRDAANGEQFLTAASEACGVRPELLSGEEEGRLSFAGATAHLPAGAGVTGQVLVVDIGGGSTELVVGHPGDHESVSAVSVDVGCVRVTERFLGHDPPAVTELAEARLAIATQLREARERLPELVPGSLLVGLAGTVSTLAALEQGLVDYDRSVLHHSLLQRGQVEHWLTTLAGEDSKARLARPGMVEGRQDVIVGGLLVLSSVMEHFACSRCLVSEDDILDGLAASLRYS